MRTLYTAAPCELTERCTLVRFFCTLVRFFALLCGFCSVCAAGYCYEAGGSVYFDTAAFTAAPSKCYGKLDPTKVAAGQAQGAAVAASGGEGGEGGEALSTDWTEGKTNAELLAEGEGALSAGAEADKRQPADFVLWKKSKVRNARLQLPMLLTVLYTSPRPSPHSHPHPQPPPSLHILAFALKRWVSQRGTRLGDVAGLAGTSNARLWRRICSGIRWI